MALLFGLSIPSWVPDSKGQHNGKGQEVRLVTYNPVPQVPEKGREQTMDWLTEVQPDTAPTTTLVDLLGVECSASTVHYSSVPGVRGGWNRKGCFRVRWQISLQRQPDCVQNLTMRLVQKEAESPCQPVVCLESSESLIR